ncbi:hypothetical protein BDK51DRAFT_40292 [Blyttiomyces helicus]|uniref:Uncharacterized protein n=1 Tax=Blyttiomyces helicus TaxID=388810 RepID=A0A4P9WC39_9FUNG|nr:hypothetical protein BDK51DRAFT_40292 [Blyttiomyces helicus]|eukprot:RKO89153.1 hypothetical protein BDK51DRAFT_40292 [Blyttiomyces helicus]
MGNARWNSPDLFWLPEEVQFADAPRILTLDVTPHAVHHEKRSSRSGRVDGWQMRRRECGPPGARGDRACRRSPDRAVAHTSRRILIASLHGCYDLAAVHGACLNGPDAMRYRCGWSTEGEEDDVGLVCCDELVGGGGDDGGGRETDGRLRGPGRGSGLEPWLRLQRHGAGRRDADGGQVLYPDSWVRWGTTRQDVRGRRKVVRIVSFSGIPNKLLATGDPPPAGPHEAPPSQLPAHNAFTSKTPRHFLRVLVSNLKIQDTSLAPSFDYDLLARGRFHWALLDARLAAIGASLVAANARCQLHRILAITLVPRFLPSAFDFCFEHGDRSERFLRVRGSNLKLLDIEGSAYVDNDLLICIGESSPHLELLDLGNYPHATDRAPKLEYDAFIAALKRRCPNLGHIRLSVAINARFGEAENLQRAAHELQPRCCDRGPPGSPAFVRDIDLRDIDWLRVSEKFDGYAVRMRRVRSFVEVEKSGGVGGSIATVAPMLSSCPHLEVLVMAVPRSYLDPGWNLREDQPASAVRRALPNLKTVQISRRRCDFLTRSLIKISPSQRRLAIVDTPFYQADEVRDELPALLRACSSNDDLEVISYGGIPDETLATPSRQSLSKASCNAAGPTSKSSISRTPAPSTTTCLAKSTPQLEFLNLIGYIEAEADTAPTLEEFAFIAEFKHGCAKLRLVELGVDDMAIMYTDWEAQELLADLGMQISGDIPGLPFLACSQCGRRGWRLEFTVIFGAGLVLDKGLWDGVQQEAATREAALSITALVRRRDRADGL